MGRYNVAPFNKSSVFIVHSKAEEDICIFYSVYSNMVSPGKLCYSSKMFVLRLHHAEDGEFLHDIYPFIFLHSENFSIQNFTTLSCSVPLQLVFTTVVQFFSLRSFIVY